MGKQKGTVEKMMKGLGECGGILNCGGISNSMYLIKSQ